MMCEFVVPVMTVSLVLAIVSGLFWTGGLDEDSETKFSQMLFGSKLRSLITAHIILYVGICVVVIFDTTLTAFDILSLAAAMEAIFLIIGPQLFLNWHIGSLSSASRNKMQIRFLEALKDPSDHDTLISQIANSLVHETRSGNRASRKVLCNIIQRQDEIGTLIHESALAIDSQLIQELQDGT